MSLEERALELDGRVDSVYFLMFPGWSTELRSNRWHYARRWARLFPVVLIQPDRLGFEAPECRAESRIPKVEILSISASVPGDLGRSLLQAAQITRHMSERGHTRPLLWNYNPNLVGVFAATPAVGRVFHATENYFDFAQVPQLFLEQTEMTLALSDLVIAVSSGVASAAEDVVSPDKVRLISNGCDLEEYTTSGEADQSLQDAGRDFDRIAVYAGNVNGRLDFALLAQAADTYPNILFAIFGPLTQLDGEDKNAWHQLLSHRNVRYFGQVAVEQLASLYRAADVGLIPYKQTRNLVSNGFPLKALEMCATGLPTVSTLMQPLRGLAAGLVVAETDAAFIVELARVSRGTMTNNERVELASLCEAHDYERKFNEAVRLVTTVTERPSLTTCLDKVIAASRPGTWEAALFDAYTTRWAIRSARPRLAARLYTAAAEAAPAPVRDAIPEPLRAFFRHRLYPS